MSKGNSENSAGAEAAKTTEGVRPRLIRASLVPCKFKPGFLVGLPEDGKFAGKIVQVKGCLDERLKPYNVVFFSEEQSSVRFNPKSQKTHVEISPIGSTSWNPLSRKNRQEAEQLFMEELHKFEEARREAILKASKAKESHSFINEGARRRPKAEKPSVKMPPVAAFPQLPFMGEKGWSTKEVVAICSEEGIEAFFAKMSEVGQPQGMPMSGIRLGQFINLESDDDTVSRFGEDTAILVGNFIDVAKGVNIIDETRGLRGPGEWWVAGAAQQGDQAAIVMTRISQESWSQVALAISSVEMTDEELDLGSLFESAMPRGPENGTPLGAIMPLVVQETPEILETPETAAHSEAVAGLVDEMSEEEAEAAFQALQTRLKKNGQ